MARKKPEIKNVVTGLPADYAAILESLKDRVR